MGGEKICYIVSNVHKSLAFEWIVSGLKQKFTFSFILLNPSSSSLEDFLLKEGIPVKRINYRGKIDFAKAFIQTCAFLFANKPKVVHAHLLDAQLVGLSAAKLLSVPVRIYTRHNSNFHQAFHPKGVIFDYFSNWLATKIISISSATDITLTRLEKVSESKIIKIPHGFDLNIFKVSTERTEQIRSKWGIEENKPVVGVIARHIEWKGVQFIIPAFRQFLEEVPTATLILANASGPYHQKILELLKQLPKESYTLIPFEEDVAALYSVFDLYVHTPIDPICEAFGQTYIEALAAGVPSIFTLSGIAAEFIKHERNALVVDFKDSDGIKTALTRLWKEGELRKHLIENGRQDVVSRFEIKTMTESLRKLYEG